MKIPTDAAIDAIQIIIDVMEQADRDGPASQINLGPMVVAEFRQIARQVMDANAEVAK